MARSKPRFDAAASITNELIEIIETDMPEDAQQLKKLLFAFEDIPTMPARARLTLFDGIAADTVIMALRGADETIRESVLAAHGARYDLAVPACDD